MADHEKKQDEPSEFLDAVKKGALLGAAILAVAIPVLRMNQVPQAPQPAQVAQQQSAGPAAQTPGQTPAFRAPALRLADFAGEEPSPDARHVANWAVHTNDPAGRAFVVIDKKEARVYLFGPDGRLAESTPALLGSAIGDHSAPGIGEKPLSAIRPEEKTTPAGRYVASPGVNTTGEDIIWIDYDAAVSMHRIRPLVAAERRLERLATPTVADNRISFGCVNLPVTFYEGTLSPAVKRYGAIVYVLPETRSPEAVFGSFDVTSPLQQVAYRPGRR